MDLSELTVQKMWSEKLQLVVFYDNDKACEKYPKLWPAKYIPAPWHNTQSCDKMVAGVANDLKDRQRDQPKKFYVTQGILTPQDPYVALHPNSTLRDTHAGKELNQFFDWLRKQKCGPGGINIVTADFIELTPLVSIVLGMNR